MQSLSLQSRTQLYHRMKVKFLKSPTAIYKLAYFPGDVADIKDKEKCLKMIEAGVAEEVKAVKKKKVSN